MVPTPQTHRHKTLGTKPLAPNIATHHGTQSQESGSLSGSLFSPGELLSSSLIQFQHQRFFLVKGSCFFNQSLIASSIAAACLISRRAQAISSTILMSLGILPRTSLLSSFMDKSPEFERSHQLRSVFWSLSRCFLINSLFSGLSNQSPTASVKASLTFQSLSVFSATTALSSRLNSEGTYPLISSLPAMNLTLPFRLNFGTTNSRLFAYAVMHLRSYA